MRALGKPLAIAAVGLATVAALGTYQLGVKTPAEQARQATAIEDPDADPFLRRAAAHAARQRCLAQRLERERAAGCIVGAVLLGILSGGPGVAAIAGCGAGMVLADADDCEAAPAANAGVATGR